MNYCIFYLLKTLDLLGGGAAPTEIHKLLSSRILKRNGSNI